MGKHPDIITGILKKLGSFERMTWHEIKTQTHDNRKSSNHKIELDELEKIARDRLMELHHEEHIDLLFSLRLKNLERILGFPGNTLV
jgi:hypothetical protein